ncbi:MAG: hypothetical protein EON56_05580 [Alphaproteobacteria bacterium]|nr:MAG: hypothetical protein EON56_05580 [Alphaproteobacteria bacterium]
MSVAVPFPYFRFAFHGPAELRPDVDPSSGERGEALEAHYERNNAPGDRLHGLPAMPLRLHDPQLRDRVREADGELYAYLECVRQSAPMPERCNASELVEP